MKWLPLLGVFVIIFFIISNQEKKVQPQKTKKDHCIEMFKLMEEHKKTMERVCQDTN